MTFGRWYEQNKTAYNAKRAEKRAKDPAYAARQKSYRKPRAKAEIPHAVSMSEVARRIEVSIWVLRAWRAKAWIPAFKDHAGQLLTHEHNLGLLVQFRDWLSEWKNRPPEDRVEDQSNWLMANWTELEIKNGTE